MTDNNQTEGNQDSNLSSSGTSQPLTADALKVLQSQVEAITKQIKDADTRWQSDKDRRIPHIEEEVSSLRKTIEDAMKLGKSGATVDEIEEQIKLKRLLSQVDAEGNLISQRRLDIPAGNQTTEAQRIAKEAGLNMNDKDIADAVANIDALPDQTGNAGKVLTTDGSTASWQEPQGGGTKIIIKRYN